MCLKGVDVMKNLLILMAFCLISSPALAVNDLNDEVQKAEAKYQKKLEKIRQKQALNCTKHPDRCSPATEQNLTLGVAQKDIKIGMSQADVALILGSPNIVTTDSNGKETWIYDKVSSVSTYNDSGFSVGIILASYGKSKESSQTVQKTLTIVIKFKDKNVESFQYHMSRF